MNVVVSKIHTDAYMEKMEGKFFSGKGYIIYDKDVDIYTGEGKLLLKFRKNIIPDKDCKLLFDNIKDAAKLGATRPNASGIPEDGKKYKLIKSKTTGKSLRVLTTKSRSGILGYYDSVSNFGYSRNKQLNKSKIRCRKTAYTLKYLDKFEKCLKVFKRIDRIYKKLVPEYYKYQKKFSKMINPDFVIKDTIFTTVTVNKNFRTALHRDSGDLKNSFGNLVVCSEGDYEGAYTLFPQYGIGINCVEGDFIAMDVHEWHCNSETKGSGDRVSCVFYLREKMLKTCPRI